MPLTQERCVPCRGGEGRLGLAEARALQAEIPAWKLDEATARIQRRFTFADFKAAMTFVNRMADIAEAEGHHPDFSVSYRTVDVSLTTHDAGGLSRNDFIVAAKLDRALEAAT